MSDDLELPQDKSVRRCVICNERPSEYITSGRCKRCECYFSANGVERPTTIVRYTTCTICNVRPHASKGRCTTCKSYFRTHGVERPTDLPIRKGRPLSSKSKRAKAEAIDKYFNYTPPKYTPQVCSEHASQPRKATELACKKCAQVWNAWLSNGGI